MDGTSITYSDRSCEGNKKVAVSRSKHRAKKFESDRRIDLLLSTKSASVSGPA